MNINTLLPEVVIRFAKDLLFQFWVAKKRDTKQQQFRRFAYRFLSDLTMAQKLLLLGMEHLSDSVSH